MKTRILNVVVGLILIVGLELASPFPAAAQLVFKNLHNFAFLDGIGPVASVLVVSNTVYGTTRTYGGGTAGGYGSLFRMNTDGSSFTNLHTFSAIAPEGGNMNAGLVMSGNTFYTTASFGGASNYGCVIAIGTDGTGETNLFSFSATGNTPPYTNSTGAYPDAGLILLGSQLYGLGYSGGTYGWGTVFAINTNGTGFTNLHDFNLTNGQYPSGDMIFSGGVLYGVTAGGGITHYGTIYQMNTNGTGYTNFYDFPAASGSPQSNSVGIFPSCTLVLSGGTLYGTAREGGDFGVGTIFSIDTNGNNFIVLHTFSATNGASANVDGANPQSGLTLVGNVLYGTTSLGGSSGNGTIFQINTDGSGFTNIHVFSATNGVGSTGKGGTNFDGAHPIGPLVFAGGALYGTTSEGGTLGNGTVFSFVTPPMLTIKLSGTNAILTWPSNLVGYNLEFSTNLAGVWNPLSGQYMVTNPVSGKQKLYRLKSP